MIADVGLVPCRIFGRRPKLAGIQADERRRSMSKKQLLQMLRYQNMIPFCYAIQGLFSGGGRVEDFEVEIEVDAGWG
jgi:hypothetical protein